MKERLTAKEQIKEMEKIIEEKAFEFCDSDGCIYSDKLAKILFLAGYRKTVWHKVADGDIPKYIGDIIMAIKSNDRIITTTGRYRLYDFYISDIGLIEKEKVIAWTELPEYKEMNK